LEEEDEEEPIAIGGRSLLLCRFGCGPFLIPPMPLVGPRSCSDAGDGSEDPVAVAVGEPPPLLLLTNEAMDVKMVLLFTAVGGGPLLFVLVL
jgi:hypothetical protein